MAVYHYIKLSFIEGLYKTFPLTTTVDFRVIATSNCLLCPAVKKGINHTHTAYIEVVSFVGTQDYRPFFKEVAFTWMKLGGVPHWAKLWSEIPGVYKYLQDYYGQSLTTFKKVFKALSSEIDTAGKEKISEMFLNSTMKQILLPLNYRNSYCHFTKTNSYCLVDLCANVIMNTEFLAFLKYMVAIFINLAKFLYQYNYNYS